MEIVFTWTGKSIVFKQVNYKLLKMLDLLNNPWVTWIGSWLIVFLVTRYIFSRWQNKEYLQKVQAANNEILYLLRPLIAQKQIPDKEIMDSLLDSVQRKFKVNKKDILSLNIIVDELTREVLENSFLDHNQKIDFCNKIKEFKTYNPKKNKEKEVFVYQKNKISSTTLSLILWIYSSLFVILQIPNKTTIWNSIIFEPILITIFTIWISLFWMLMYQRTIKITKNNYHKEVMQKLHRKQKEIERDMKHNYYSNK